MWRVYTLFGSWIFYNWGITANFRHCGICVTDFLLEEGLRGLLLPLDLWKTSKSFIFIIIKQHDFKKMLWFAMICLYLETAIPHTLILTICILQIFFIFNFQFSQISKSYVLKCPQYESIAKWFPKGGHPQKRWT